MTNEKSFDKIISVTDYLSVENGSLKTKQNRNVNVLKDLNYELYQLFIGEFDPGSGRTLAACLIHASRADQEET